MNNDENYTIKSRITDDGRIPILHGNVCATTPDELLDKLFPKNSKGDDINE